MITRYLTEMIVEAVTKGATGDFSAMQKDWTIVESNFEGADVLAALYGMVGGMVVIELGENPTGPQLDVVGNEISRWANNWGNLDPVLACSALRMVFGDTETAKTMSGALSAAVLLLILAALTCRMSDSELALKDLAESLLGS